MEPARRALLIGIGDTPAATALESLAEPVEADLRLLSTALKASGYEVDTLHDAGRSQIRSTIYEVAQGCPPGGTLLLYFTGHGLRVNRTDYLVPADVVPPADGNWREPYLDSLLPVNINPLLGDCAAGTVLWFVDACRTDTASDGEAFANRADTGPPHGGFAVMAGCSAGQRSGYTGEGSFFARGLADALGPLTPARTVEDVLAAARARTTEAAWRHRLVQVPWFHYGSHAEDETRKTEICEGRPLLEAWLDAARTTPLWRHVAPGAATDVDRLQDALSEFVEDCARTVHLAQRRMPYPDPWTDDAFPVRLLCDRLPLLLPEGAELSPVEVVTLVAAPFLHEVAWAERLSQAAELGADTFGSDNTFGAAGLGRCAPASAHRRHYEQIVEQYGRVARKLADCKARERTEDSTALAMWLVHRWIADRFQTDDEVVPAQPAEALAARLGVAGSRVRDLAELLRAAASAVGPDEPLDELAAWTPRKVVLPGGGHQQLRIRPLAALLRLASTLALDVRTLADIVAEHLAVSDPVLPQQTVAVAHELSWHHDGNALHLDAPCPHQAVHAALLETVDAADQLAARIGEMTGGLPEPEARLLAAVPGRVTDRDLRPQQRGGRQPAYEVPLLRFHLAQTEVRDLLMGEQLYGGEPQLALRELYQNAMDACRYRAMRWEYLGSTGRRPASWTGRIVFTQGRDERGRYVECRDNGVGMSAEQLKQTFTRAGSRFERSASFRKEQSRWLRHDPALRLYPNSRFGIGVFSYFMLADEMTIVTRQVSPDGIPAEHAFRVEIPSSGSLFRIQQHDGSDDGVAEGGTRVRLYLRDDDTRIRRLSCVTVLRELVRVAEFALEAREGAGHEHVWEAGVLQPALGTDPADVLEGVPGALWWVDGEGAILCDGIVTDRTPFGYVVNLTGPHAGKLSVSRKELQHYDAEWVEALWRRGAAKLAAWPGLSTAWVGRLDDRSPAAARVLDTEWRGKGVHVRGWDGDAVDLDHVGWFHLDQVVNDVRLGSRQAPFAPWRAVALGLSHDSRHRTGPSDVSGYPVPAAGDADLVRPPLASWCEVVAHAAAYGTSVENVLRRRRALRVVHRRYAPLPYEAESLDWVPDASDHDLVTALTDDNTAHVPGGDGSRHWGGLILASVQLSAPLGELVERLARFAPLLPSSVPEVPPPFQDHVCTQEDLESVFHHTQFASPAISVWSLADGPLRVCDVAKQSGRPVAEVLRRLADFSWLGWTAPTSEAVAPWSLLADDEDLDRVVRLFNRRRPEGGRELRWAATIDFAQSRETDLAEAERQLAHEAGKLGLHYERRYTRNTSAARVQPSRDAALLVRHLQDMGCPLEQGLDLEALSIAHTTGHGWMLSAAVSDLRNAGVRVPADVNLVAHWGRVPLRDRYILSGKEPSIPEENYAAAGIYSETLFYSAERLSETLREVWTTAGPYAKRYGLTMPSLPEDLVDLRPTRGMAAALVTHPGNARTDSNGTAKWQRLTPLGLATYARRRTSDTASAYERLLPLRSIGALVPEITAAELAALRGLTPDERDLVALASDHRVTAEDAPYCALDLLSIAGRLGEPLPRTVERIAPYLPLCAEPCALPPVPPVLPLWQDLALLSENLDGVLPALEGRVGRRHIRRAAAATGESEAWIAERLRLYATMFDLVVDEKEDEDGDE
ncbi:Histidine kinase-, DNA gyrase B-, and HSP90-like ATPase [Streptomyces sp. yr375]|uniref:HD domain-containing protein n=1 Tax=Streptomyces sp. yr375 TaxID=1761906 RepID=UPI0008C92815|nr:caspase family protein [Streptomyces sp. yr375]SEQ78539.1 Histidine kinase-, DNA gyrase B-, and HSP90-like ATPase [Streptomyces sp. yr375]